MIDPVEQRARIVAGRTIAMDRLAVRERSRGELLDSLAKRDFDQELAGFIVDQLQAEGLVDDERFARAWVESRSRGKGLAASVLRLELRAKQVDDDIVDAVLAEIDPGLERQLAHQLVQRKLRTVRGLDRQVQTRRLVAMLARKGYGPQLAFEVVRAELDVESEPIESV